VFNFSCFSVKIVTCYKFSICLENKVFNILCDMIWIGFNEDRILTCIQKYYNWCVLSIIRNPIFWKGYIKCTFFKHIFTCTSHKIKNSPFQMFILWFGLSFKNNYNYNHYTKSTKHKQSNKCTCIIHFNMWRFHFWCLGFIFWFLKS
jgi:hypothetical protein